MSKNDLKNQTLIPQIAALRVLGKSIRVIAKETKENEAYLRKLITTDEFKQYSADMVSEVMVHSKQVLRNTVADLIPEAVRALKVNLGKNDMTAVKLVFQAVGVDQMPTEKEEKAQILHVILPGARDPITVESKIYEPLEGGS